MAVSKRTSTRSSPKTKRKPANAPQVNLVTMLEEHMSSQPIGKALSAIDILYQELDDMQMRLDILISRIDILKKRTSALRQGELVTLNTMLGALDGRDNASTNLKSKKATGEAVGEDGDGKVEWTKLKLLEETTINDVLLAIETVVSLESKAAAGLVEQGVAKVIEEPAEETKEEEVK